MIFPYILTCLVVMLSSVFWNVLRQMSIPEIMADAGSWFWASVYGSGTITEFCGWHFRIIGAIWFLLAMFWADIIFDIILLKTKHACIWVMAIAAVGYITSAWIWLPFSFQAGLTAMLFVWIGYKARQVDLLNKYLDNIWALALALVLRLNSIINGGELYMVTNHYGDGLFDVLGDLGAAFVIIKLSRRLSQSRLIKPISDFLSIYGRNSLIVLCIHLIELDTFPWYVISSRLPYALGIIVLFVLKVMLSVIGVWGVKRMGRFKLDTRNKWKVL